MTNLNAARIDRTPTHNDLEIANLVHCALATIQDTGRFSDRKGFISSLWTMMLRLEAQTGGTLTDGLPSSTSRHGSSAAGVSRATERRWGPRSSCSRAPT